jgi:hypothetical protein
MPSFSIPAEPIYPGFPFRLEIEAEMDPPFFPAGSAHVAQIRKTLASGTVVEALSTTDGTIERLDDHTCVLTLAPAATAAWKMDSVIFDIVRTDTTPNRYSGFTVTVPVLQTVTRGVAE